MDMNKYVLIAASMAFVLTAVNQVFTLPAGIKSILNEDMPRPLLVCKHAFGFLMYTGWCVYGLLLSDVAIIFGCGMGVVSSLILLGYTFWLRKAKVDTAR
jgi:hypothetical protein